MSTLIKKLRPPERARISTSMSAEEAEALIAIFSALEIGGTPSPEVITSAGFAGLCRVVQSMKRRMQARSA